VDKTKPLMFEKPDSKNGEDKERDEDKQVEAVYLMVPEGLAVLLEVRLTMRPPTITPRVRVGR